MLVFMNLSNTLFSAVLVKKSATLNIISFLDPSNVIDLLFVARVACSCWVYH